jgi:predicted PurR-regulated permease PerM
MKDRVIRERIFFFILVGILILLTLILIWPFLSAILAAVAFVVILKPLYSWLLEKGWVKGSENRAVAATIIIFILVIAIPAVLIVGAAISQADALLSGEDLGGVERSLESAAAQIEESIQGIAGEVFQVDEAQIAEAIQDAIKAGTGWLGDLLISLGKSLPLFFTTIVIVLVLMVVLLPRYKRPGRQDLVDVIPLPKEITHLYLDKIDLMIVAMFRGTIVIAIIQGLAMGVVFWIAGVPYVPLLTVASMLASIIPVAGISWVAWPVGIILILQGNVVEGVFVIVSFLVIVSNIDTVLRPRMVPKGAYLNPALVLLSVFGGLQLMGLIGIFYGPVIMILLVTSVDVYTKYMLRSDLEMLAEGEGLDLQELGLATQEDEVEKEDSGETMALIKSLAARVRRGPLSRETESEVSE